MDEINADDTATPASAPASDEAPPQRFEALRALILARHGDLPKRLAQIARFALDNPDRMALSTVAELAEAAGVQPSTLVRFAQSLGYAGFSDLQSVFRAELRGRWPDYRERLARVKNESGADPSRILDGFIDTATRSLEQLGRTVLPGEFAEAARLLAQARTIYLLGQRRAFPVAAYLAHAFAKLERPAVLLDNLGSMLDLQAARCGEGDALVAISFSPYTQSTVDMATAAAGRGASVIAITDSVFSPISGPARIRLEVVEADLGAFRSLSATLALAMALAVAAAEAGEAASPA